MLDSIFKTIISDTITPSAFLLCTAVSIILGLALAAAYMFRSSYTKSFVVTLALLPAIVQVVIMLVNGNLGVGVAVMGAFSLVRFRSAPGSAREILSIFMAMAIGLASGVGYIGIAVIFTAVLLLLSIVYSATGFGDGNSTRRELRVTIPESLNYSGEFDDLFEKYTTDSRLLKVKTCNMGSMYRLHYEVKLKSEKQEKEFIDELRCRNGNLEIIISRCAASGEEL